MSLYQFIPPRGPAGSQQNGSSGCGKAEDLGAALLRLRDDAIRQVVETYMRMPQPLRLKQLMDMAEEIVHATEPLTKMIERTKSAHPE